eukprot:5790098-Amphidinium_carterae.1
MVQLGGAWNGFQLDLRDIRRATVFMWCEFALVAARRLPYGKTKLRRFALRHRPHAALEPADPIYMSSPPHGSPASSARSRRPLAAIQTDYQLVAGGQRLTLRTRLILCARTLSNRRVRMARWQRWSTTYNPRSSTAKGDCLFMVLSKYVSSCRSAKEMRMNIRSHAAALLASGDALHDGKSLAELLVEFGIDPTWYMSTLAPPCSRWGNTLDAMVASHLYQINFHIFDIAKKRYALKRNEYDVTCTIGYLKHHFVAGMAKPRPLDFADRFLDEDADEDIVGSTFTRVLTTVLGCVAMWLCATTVGQPEQLVCGGAMRAGIGAPPHPRERPFSVIGVSEDGSTRHLLRNAHELANMCANYVDDEEEVHEPEEIDEFGYGMGSFQRVLEGDERALISLLLRRIRRSLFAISRIGARIWNFPSGTPDNDEEAVTDDAVPPSSPGMQSYCSSRSSLVLEDFEYESSYDPCSLCWSCCASWSRGSTSPGSNQYVFPGEFAEWSSCNSEQSCLNSNRTVRMQSHCSTPCSVRSEDFDQFSPVDDCGWANPLQLIPLALEFWDADNHAIQQELIVEGRRRYFEHFEAGRLQAEHPQQENLAGLQARLNAVAIDVGFVYHSPIDVTSFESDQPCSIGLSASSADPWCLALEKRFVMVMEDGSLLYGGHSNAHESAVRRDVCWVTGGMPPKRAYPFGPCFTPQQACSTRALETVENAAVHCEQKQQQQQQLQQVTLIFHGSFAPFHRGHISCVTDAKRLLQSHGFIVEKTIIACTTDHQVCKKLKCQADSMLVNAADRIKLVRALVQAVQLDDIEVADCAYRSGDSVSFNHYTTPGSVHIHLVGSDVRLKPSPRTVVVVRHPKDRIEADYFDSFRLFGICNQTAALGTSSTSIRATLQRGDVPTGYPAEVLDILNELFAGSKRQATADVDGAAITLDKAAATATSSSPPPVAKAMPLKRMHPPSRTKGTMGKCASVSTSGGVSGADAGNVAPTNRPPLKRRRVQLTLAGPLHCSGISEAISAVPMGERASMPADRLQHAGVFKLAPPCYAHLGSFFKYVVQPFCTLLGVVPHFVSRRNGEDALRVPYSPAARQATPLALLTSVEQFMDFRHALSFVSYIAYYYIALTTDNLLVADKDGDTMRGIAVRQIFGEVAGVLQRELVYGKVITTFTMFDAHHVVCILRPDDDEPVPIGVVTENAVRILNDHFRTARATSYANRQSISFSAETDKCLFFTGGGRSVDGETSQSDNRSSRSLSLFAPDESTADPVGECLLWAYYAQRQEPVVKGITAENLRVMVRMWLRTADKFSFVIAGGVTVAQIAVWWDMTTDSCIAQLCAITDALELNAVFIYAAGCVLSISVALVDADGECQDGFIRTRGFGLKRSHGCWHVVAPFADSECLIQELSPTLEFVDPCNSSSSTLTGSLLLPVRDMDIGQTDLFLEGGGKRKHGHISDGITPASQESDWSHHSCESIAALPEASSESLQADIFMPTWELHGADAARRLQTLFVSVGTSAPVPISVPCYWSVTHTEDKLAMHVGAKRDWLSFTWANMDVYIELLGSYPKRGSTEMTNLFLLFDSAVGHGNDECPGSDILVMGATDEGATLSDFARQHSEFVCSITCTLTSLLPDAVFDIVSLECKPAANQSFVLPCHAGLGAVLIPKVDEHLSWIWLSCDTGTEVNDVDGHDCMGVYVPFNRMIFCPSGEVHRFHSASPVSAIAAYRSQIVPSTEQLASLHDLGFPLDVSQLARTNAAEAPAAGAPDKDVAIPIGASRRRRPTQPQHAATGSGCAQAAPLHKRAAKQFSQPIGARQPPHRPPPTAHSSTGAGAGQVAHAGRIGFKKSVVDRLDRLSRQQNEMLDLLRLQQAQLASLLPAQQHDVGRTPANPHQRGTNVGDLGSHHHHPGRGRAIGARIPTAAASSGAAPWRLGGCNGLFRRSVAKLKELGKFPNVKQLTICSGKARPIVLTYRSRLSSRQILEYFAAQKRVGRQYLALRLRTKKGVKMIGHDSTPVYANWNNRKVEVINSRYATINRPVIDQKLKLEMDTDELVDKCVLNSTFMQSDDANTLPVRVIKCTQNPPHRRPAAGCAREQQEPASRSRQSEPITVQLYCQVLSPRCWTLGRILQAVKNAIHADRCVFEPAQDGVTVRLGINAMEATP